MIIIKGMVLEPSRYLPTVAALGLLAVAAVGCDRQPPWGTAQAKLQIIVSIAPQAWLVKQIGGERVRVMTVVRSGQSPVTYQPSDAQVSELMRSAAYFSIGVPFERGAWFTAITRSQQVHIVYTREGITLRQMRSSLETGPDHAHHDGHLHDNGKDPHIWTSPQLLILQARTIAKTLSELDLPHATHYLSNLSVLESKLTDLHEQLSHKLKPLKGHVFFVFHPSWGYFADAYGLRQMAIEIEGKEPTDHELTQLLKVAREHDVKVIFVQPQISGRAAESIARATGAKVQTLDPLAENIVATLQHMAETLARWSL